MKKLAKLFCKKTGIPIYFIKNVLFELNMAFVRLHKHSSKFKKSITKINNELSPAIILGCGNTCYSGWYHIDSKPIKHVDLVMDLRQQLPFKDKSILYCYSEHFLEHLTPSEVDMHLMDIYRVLKLGGVYRIVVPDAGKFMIKYAQGDNEFFSFAHPWEKHPLDAIFQIVNWSGEHRSIFDFQSLQRKGFKAGFERIILSSENASGNDKLRIDRKEPQRVAESIYVEMQKGL